jgi:pimeloyl-ACP methyl ester carboxylesterase
VQPISFTYQSDRLHGNLFVADKPKAMAYLLLHGWLGSQNVLAAQALANLGYTSMTYDMRGNKSSEGDATKLTKADFLHDAVIAYDFFRTKVGDKTPIGIVGASFGSYLGTLLTTERAVSCLSLRVPANYPDDMFNSPEPTALSARHGLYDEWRRRPLAPSENKALAALHAFQGNVQIIEAELDDQIPHQTILNYMNSIDDKQRLSYSAMEGAPHSLTTPKLNTTYQQLLCAWAQNQ